MSKPSKGTPVLPVPDGSTRTGLRAVEFREGGLLRLEIIDAAPLTMAPDDRAFLEELLRLIERYEGYEAET